MKPTDDELDARLRELSLVTANYAIAYALFRVARALEAPPAPRPDSHLAQLYQAFADRLRAQGDEGGARLVEQQSRRFTTAPDTDGAGP